MVISFLSRGGGQVGGGRGQKGRVQLHAAAVDVNVFFFLPIVVKKRARSSLELVLFLNCTKRG